MSKFTEYRREFHKYAENGWDEIRTSARIAEILTEMGYDCLMGPDVVEESAIIPQVHPSDEKKKENCERAIAQGANPEFVALTKGLPGVIAIFDTGVEGPTTAFRFDIDCLPYDEPKTPGYRPFDEGYASVNPGCDHACGHDSHTAMGLGIAAGLLEKKDSYKGKIKLIFQPAEETWSGAQSIIAKGHLDDVENFLAMHVALSAENEPMPSHVMCCGTKDFVSDRQLDVTFHGRAAHPSGAAQEGKNALLAACTAALNLHAIAKHEKGLSSINVGELYAGIAPNTIAPNALMKVEFRGEKPEISAYMAQRAFAIINAAATMYEMEVSISDYGEVPAGESDDAMIAVVERAAHKVPWFETIHTVGNVGGTDDAAAMMTKVQQNGGKGAYIGIGTTTTQPVHNAEFDFDEDAIGAAIDLCMYALDELHGR